MKVPFLFFAMFSLSSYLQGELVLIVSRGFPVEEITSTTLKRLYMGHLSFLDGKRITINQLEGDSLESFCKTYLQMTKNHYERRWTRRIFTGKGRIPRTFKTHNELLKFLSEEEHGLGFVDSETPLPDGVRKIRILMEN